MVSMAANASKLDREEFSGVTKRSDDERNRPQTNEIVLSVPPETAAGYFSPGFTRENVPGRFHCRRDSKAPNEPFIHPGK